jgi:MurNAc alpha-1-phosphate uridylyltransferase
MAARIETAMVLAAGYGTRLRPLTDHTPKPLVPVAGKPMVEYALERLRDYGVSDVVINVSHLKEQLLDYLACSPGRGLRFRVSEEAEPLETGGGLKRALPLLGDHAFFAINSDIIWLDPPGQKSALSRLAAHWDPARMDILLLVQSRAGAVGYDLGEDHLFVKAENTFEWSEADAPYVVAGLSLVHPRVFAQSPEGKFSVKVLWLEALRRNRLFCLPHKGLWFQAGRIQDLKRTEEILNKLGGG